MSGAIPKKPATQQVAASRPIMPVPSLGGAEIFTLGNVPGAAPPPKKYRCTRCKCESQIRTHCAICKTRNCMELVIETVILKNEDAAVPGKKSRGKMSSAIQEAAKIIRRKTGIPKLDKVLGGGYVDKTAILMAGEPGAGKSTLLMQACIAFAGPERLRKGIKREPEVFRALYISGEEAFEQVGARAARLPGIMEKADHIEFVATRSVPEAMGAILDVKPHLVVADSIQELGDEALSGRFGGEHQVANVIRSIMASIREVGFGTAFFVGHVKKDGDIAGSKKAEHLVDTVLKFTIDLREEEEDEDDDDDDGSYRKKKKKGRPEEPKYHDERLLEPLKNRYGSIIDHEIFTMTKEGLV